MADRVVLVNGLPASGKTTLAIALANRDRPLVAGLATIGGPGFWDEAAAVTEDPVIVDTAGEVDVAALAARVRTAVAP